MSIYTAIESIVVAVLALVSVFYVLKLIVPGPMQSIRNRLADRLSRMAGHSSALSSLAAQLRVEDPSRDCATGCSSGCDGCSVAGRAGPLAARDGVDHA
jgi:hypothetical protein